VAIFDRLCQLAPALISAPCVRSIAHLYQLRLGLAVLKDQKLFRFAQMLVDENSLHACDRDVWAT
jgi:hypothetical protein